jgi:hypothetical protein
VTLGERRTAGEEVGNTTSKAWGHVPAQQHNNNYYTIYSVSHSHAYAAGGGQSGGEPAADTFSFQATTSGRADSLAIRLHSFGNASRQVVGTPATEPDASHIRRGT